MTHKIVEMIKIISHQIDKRMQVKIGKRLERDFDLTSQQLRVLCFIINNKISSQKEIEKRFSLSSATVSGILKRLEKNGYLLRVQNKDRRSNSLEASLKALNVNEILRSIVNENDKEIEKDITEEELLVTYRVLKKIIENMEDLKND